MSQANKVNLYAGQVILGGKFTIDENGNIGAGTAAAATVSIGNTVGASALVLNAGTGGISIPGGTVTQITDVNTAVTLNAISGVITTFSQSAVADDADIFTVNNSIVEATDRILVNVVDYAGTYVTNGIPVVNVDNIGAGSFDIVVINTHGTNALSGVLQISFVVLK